MTSIQGNNGCRVVVNPALWKESSLTCGTDTCTWSEVGNSHGFTK